MKAGAGGIAGEDVTGSERRIPDGSLSKQGQRRWGTWQRRKLLGGPSLSEITGHLSPTRPILSSS